MRTPRTAVIGIFPDPVQAWAAVRALQDARFTSDQIGVMTERQRIEPVPLDGDGVCLLSKGSTLVAVGNTSRLAEAFVILREHQGADLLECRTGAPAEQDVADASRARGGSLLREFPRVAR